jgi:hypothetical protein
MKVITRSCDCEFSPLVIIDLFRNVQTQTRAKSQLPWYIFRPLINFNQTALERLPLLDLLETLIRIDELKVAPVAQVDQQLRVETLRRDLKLQRRN